MTSTYNPLYLCGPMRGYDLYNFPAFMEADEKLSALGYSVINPAKLDLNEGFDPKTGVVGNKEMEYYVRRDVESIIKSKAVVALPGWQMSAGAHAEVRVAIWLRRPYFELEEFLEKDNLTQTTLPT